MKRLGLLLFAVFGFSMFSLQAQDKLNEGYIKYEITDILSEDEQMQAMLGMMKGTTNEVYFNKKQALTKMNMMGGMMKMTFLSNLEDKSGTMLFDAMGQKYMVPMSAEDAKVQEEKMAENTGNIEFEYLKDDVKTIAGYECYRVAMKSTDIEGFEMSAYVTEDIISDANIMQGIESTKLKGFPLEYIVNNGQFSMVFSAIEILKELDITVFNIDTKGFKEMTMEEFQDAMGQMGGMGF